MNPTETLSPAWAEMAFQTVNMIVLPGWMILFFAPKWQMGARLISGVVIPGLLSIAYVCLVVASMNAPEAGGPADFTTLTGIMRLFDNPVGVVAGWTHYLVFDLVTGSWIVRDAVRHQISHRFVIPCLFLTFLLGPLGFLMYLALRSWKLNRISLDT